MAARSRKTRASGVARPVKSKPKSKSATSRKAAATKDGKRKPVKPKAKPASQKTAAKPVTAKSKAAVHKRKPAPKAKPKAPARKPAAAKPKAPARKLWTLDVQTANAQAPTTERRWRVVLGAPKPPTRPRRSAALGQAEQDALEQFRARMGLPQAYDPRRPPQKLTAAPDWERGKKLAGGTWKKLAAVLHVAEYELSKWRKNSDETGRQRLAGFIAETEKSLKRTADDMRTFNELRKRAGDLDFYPSYQTSQGRRNGPFTVGYFWTLSVVRSIDQQVIAMIMRWFDGLKGKVAFDLWHSTGMVHQYGGQGYRRVSGKVSLVMAEKDMPNEAADYSAGYISNVPVGKKEMVRAALQYELEKIAEEDATNIIDWVTVRNYRKKTAEEQSDYRFNYRAEQKKRKMREKNPEPIDNFRRTMFGKSKKGKKSK